MPIVETMSQLAAPWAHLYNNSKVLSVGTTFVHLASLVGAGGLAIAADRQSLRLAPGDRDAIARHVTEQGTLHRFIVGGLTLSAVSGAMIFASDVTTFATSPLYWVKMGAVALLLGNGLRLMRAEQRLAADAGDAAGLRGLRRAAIASLVLWFAVTLLGTVLRTEA